jgi:EAL domain-containing protein (putative c-di-GMP-specific phosphodiesterase class I)
MVAEAVAARIQEALRAPFWLADKEVYASASIGISIYPMDAHDADSLLQHADSAMYASKRVRPGGNQVYSLDRPGSAGKLTLATRLRKAVEQEQWLLHYQPIVDLRTGQIVSVEALVRWLEPGGQMVPPNDFIPLAEKLGLIEAIGEWVIRETARQARDWHDWGLPINVGFNLSPRQLWRGDLAERISAQFQAVGIPPNAVTVEVTESAAMTDPDRALRVLGSLRDRGFKIALDDFGTGFSSLSRLKDLPIDVLKIDRSFIRHVPEEPAAVRMVTGIIYLARSLNMTPLAEGIETEEQWAFLRQHGCARGQGYLFARPVPAKEILERYLPAFPHESTMRLAGAES